jgi:hypothetical protein
VLGLAADAVVVLVCLGIVDVYGGRDDEITGVDGLLYDDGLVVVRLFVYDELIFLFSLNDGSVDL